jgi:hypothetical protein
MHHARMSAVTSPRDRSRSNHKRRRAWFVLLTALAAAAIASCQVSVGDQSCTEESNPNDKEDTCPYGPPGGPKVQETGCPNIPPEPDPANCTVTWPQVYEILRGPSAGCTINGCHGEAPGARGIFLSPTDSNAFYDELKGYVGSQGYPYINEEQPDRSWILCNLTGLPGGGAPMPPPSGLGDADFAIIQQWAMCGLKRTGGVDGGL